MGSCRSGPAEHKRSLNWCYNINWLVVRFDLCGLWQMVGLESQNLPQNSASVVRNFLLGGSGHENIPCCHVFFYILCSVYYYMCSQIQNTKLTKVRSKQLNLLFHLKIFVSWFVLICMSYGILVTIITWQHCLDFGNTPLPCPSMPWVITEVSSVGRRLVHVKLNMKSWLHTSKLMKIVCKGEKVCKRGCIPSLACHGLSC